MQSQMMALLMVSEGTSVVTETVFENRFMHVEEFQKMSAQIKVEGRSAIVSGGLPLTGAKVCATDLRAGAALVCAALYAEGETEITGIHHVDRGYVDITGKLAHWERTSYRVDFEEQSDAALHECRSGALRCIHCRATDTFGPYGASAEKPRESDYE